MWTIILYSHCVQLSSVQSVSCVRLFATLWTAARQASLSITSSRSPPKPMSIESVMPPSHLILCRTCPTSRASKESDFFFFICLFIWLHWVLAMSCRVLTAAWGLSSCSTQAPELGGSVGTRSRLNCPAACGILDPGRDIEALSSALCWLKK